MDPLFLAAEAQKLHGIFENAFFLMLAGFLALAVVLELLKIPIGESPGIATLVGRALLATLLLVALPDIMNFVADATDSVSREIGDLNNFHVVLSRLGEKLKDLSFSWTSLKDMVTILISFLSFFGLYITIYFAEAAFLYAWTLIYVFSPLVLALYIFPATAGATKALFRSILEVSMWKIAWASMAALLWSTALSDINKPSSHVSWLTSIVLNLMLMISILMTPKIVRAIFSGGVAEVAGAAQSAILGAAALTPPVALAKVKTGITFIPTKAAGFATRLGSAAVKKAGSSIKERKNAGHKPAVRDQFRKYSPITPTNYTEVKREFLASQNKRNH